MYVSHLKPVVFLKCLFRLCMLFVSQSGLVVVDVLGPVVVDVLIHNPKGPGT